MNKNEIEFTPQVETEWISALKKHGIIEKTEEQVERIQEEQIDKTVQFNKKLADNEDDLDALFEELNDEDEKTFEEYRQKRLANLRAEYDRKKFGSVMEITKQNYVDEVNNAGDDVWVVVHVYKPGMMLCSLINQFLNELAIRFKTTKFVKSIVDLCIPNFPEQNLPAIFVYHNGNVIQKLLGESQIGNLNMKCEDLEWILHKIGAIEQSSLESDPRQKRANKSKKTFFSTVADSDSD